MSFTYIPELNSSSSSSLTSETEKKEKEILVFINSSDSDSPEASTTTKIDAVRKENLIPISNPQSARKRSHSVGGKETKVDDIAIQKVKRKTGKNRKDEQALAESVNDQNQRIISKKKQGKKATEELGEGSKSAVKIRKPKSHSMIVRRRSNTSDKLEGAAKKTRDVTSNKLATSKPQSGDLTGRRIKKKKREGIKKKEKKAKVEKKGSTTGYVAWKDLNPIESSEKKIKRKKREKITEKEKGSKIEQRSRTKYISVANWGKKIEQEGVENKSFVDKELEEILGARRKKKSKSRGGRKNEKQNQSTGNLNFSLPDNQRHFDVEKSESEEKKSDVVDIDNQRKNLRRDIESQRKLATIPMSDIIMNLGNQDEKLANKRAKLKKIEDFHKEMDRIIEQNKAFNFEDIMQFRNYILVTYLPTLSKFYLKNKVLKTEFDEKLKALYDIQETKGAEFATNKRLADYEEEHKEEALLFLQGFDLEQIEKSVQDLCQKRREKLIGKILIGKGFLNKKYGNLIEQFATELNLGAFDLFRKQSNKKVMEGLGPLKIRYEKITHYVTNTILGVKNPHDRMKVYVFFLDIAEHLSDNKHDYYNGRAIIDGLSNSRIERTLRMSSDPMEGPDYLNPTQRNKRAKLLELYSLKANFKALMKSMSDFGNAKDFLPEIGSFCKHEEYMRTMGEELTKEQRDEQVKEYFQPIKRCMDSAERNMLWEYVDFVSFEETPPELEIDERSNYLRDEFVREASEKKH